MGRGTEPRHGFEKAPIDVIALRDEIGVSPAETL
jgi:hypothetical protein